MILIGLFPIVIFNKTLGSLSKSGKYKKTRIFNWFLLLGITTIGGLGVYSGIQDLRVEMGY